MAKAATAKKAAKKTAAPRKAAPKTAALKTVVAKTFVAPAAAPTGPEALVDIPPRNTFNQNLTSTSEATMLQIFGVPGTKTQDCSPATGGFQQPLGSPVPVGPLKVSGPRIAFPLLNALFPPARRQTPNLISAATKHGRRPA